MASRINIAEFDIDIDALTKKASEVRVNLIEIGKEISQLKKDFKDGNISVNEYAVKLTTLTTVQKENQKELRVYDTMLQASLATEAKKDEGNKRLTGSIRELSASLSQNKKTYQELSEEERNNAEIGGKLLKTIQEQDQKYKQLQKSIGNTQVEVGNYKEEVKKALQEHYSLDAGIQNVAGRFGVFSTAVTAGANSLKTFVIGQKATETSTKATSIAFRIFRGALLATGIGAVVVLLGSLIAYLTSTQEGINKVNSVLTPLKEVFASLWGVVQNVGKALFDAFTSPQKALDLLYNQTIGRFAGIKDTVMGVVSIFTKGWKQGLKEMGDGVLRTVTGVEKMTDKISSLGDTMSEAWERGKKIHELEKELREFNIDYKRQHEELNRQFREQKEIAGDITKSFEERRKASQNAIDLQNQIIALAEKRNGLEVDLIKLKQQANDTDDAGKKELQDKLAELDNERSINIKKRTEATNQLNSINKEASAEAKKRIEADIEEQKKQVEHYLKTNSAVAKSLQERLDLEEKAKDERLAILERERKIGNITKADYEREKDNIELEHLKLRADLSLEAVQKEAELYEANNKTKIDKETKLTAELITEEQNRLQAIHDKKVEALEEEKRLKTEAREWDYNAEAEYQAQLNELKQSFAEEYQETTKSLNETFEAQQREEKKTQQALDWEEKLVTLQEQNAYQWEIEAVQLQQKHEQERNALDELLANKKISQEQYNQALATLNRKQAVEDINLKKKTEEAKMQLAVGALGQAKQLFGEHTAIGKASAIAEATINTYLGVTKALSAYPPPMNYVMAGLTGALGFKNIQKIISTDTKFQHGGLVKGRSHADGGVPFTVQGQGGYEMEGGEYIVNKKATLQYFPILEALNKSTLGVHHKQPKFFQYGGLVSGVTNPVSKIDMTEIVDAVREGSMLGAYEGAKQGSQEGAHEGARQGAYEGATQGTYEGATVGTSAGIYEGGLKLSDNNNTQNTQEL